MARPACILGLASVGLALGCGDPEPQRELFGQEAQAVVGGTPSGPDRDATALIVFEFDPATPGAFYICSGVLLAPNLLATARHCFADISPAGFLTSAPFECGANGEPIDDGLGGGYIIEDGNPADLKVYVGNVVHDIVGEPPAARGLEVIHDGANTLCSHDIAFVVLDREIPDVPPMQLRWETPPQQGEPVTLVGWGKTDGGSSSYQPKSHYSSPLPIIAVGPEQPDPAATGPGVVPRTFETGPGQCHGDSGGPSLDGAGLVLGIASRFTGVVSPTAPDPCAVATNESVFMQLASFHDIIEEAFVAAEQVPWLEGSPRPGTIIIGEQCAADHDCESGVCGIDGSAEVGQCTTACTADDECEEGLVCRPEGGFCGVPLPVSADEDGAASSCAFAPPSRGSLWWLLPAAALAWARRRANASCRGDAGSRSARCG
jgi:hypothetical protein